MKTHSAFTSLVPHRLNTGKHRGSELRKRQRFNNKCCTGVSRHLPSSSLGVLSHVGENCWHTLAPLPQSLLLSENRDLPATQQTFEPVLNVPALGSFLFIMLMALLLRLRISAIGEAAEERIVALETLRKVKSQELSSDVTQAQVDRAIQGYRNALQKEEGLRTLVPGIRLRAPNNPNQSEKDIQAARQFLGIEQNSVEEDPPSRYPVPLLITLWTFVFGSLLALFFFLSMDDTTANDVFNALNSNDNGSNTVAESVGGLLNNE